MYSAEELEDLAYKLLVCTNEERQLIVESLTDWELREVERYTEQILTKMENWK